MSGNEQNHNLNPENGVSDTTAQQLDAVEAALLDLQGAERAGVFVRSKVPADILYRGHRSQFLRIWTAPLAAAVVLAFAVGTYFFQKEVELVKIARASNAWGGALSACMQSGENNSEICRANDGDGDGDFDLADFGRFQVAYGTDQ
ncbi:MAG: hypothetical protein ACPGXK_14130 [Phycisphaerae bacterium]